VIIIWIMLALGVGAPVAVFVSDIVGLVLAVVIVMLGAVVAAGVARDDRAARRARVARRTRLDEHGVTVRAIVAAVTRPELGLVGVGDRMVVNMTIDLDGSGTGRRIEIDCLVDPIEIPRVQPGCVIGFRSDPDDPTNYEVELSA
jgi:hypothetical protein